MRNSIARRSLAPFAFLLALALSFGAGAEALLKTLPTPDLSKLPPQQAEQLRQVRQEFERAKVGLVGDAMAEAFVKVAALHARYGIFDVAQVALDNAIALSPYDGRYPYLRGFFAAEQGQLPQARQLLERALELDLAYLPIRYRLAQVQLQQGDYAAVRKTLGDLANTRKDLAPAPAMLGEAALREKRYADAIRLLEAALKADPGATSLYPSLAAAYEGNGDKPRATAARAKAGPGLAAFGDPLVQGIYATTPNDPGTRALLLAANRQHGEARKLLDEALKERANDATLLAAYARVEADAGNLPAARQRADAALKADANSAPARLAQGIVLEIAGQEPQAIAAYEQAVRADLKLAEARLMLGNAYMRARNYGAATEQYRSIGESGDSSGFRRLAAAQAQQGRCGEALAAVNAALKTRPKDGVLLQTFVRLAASCAAAQPAERQMALDYGKSLYDQRPTPDHAEAYAMALAANGKAKDAVGYEAQTIFEAVKANDQATVTRSRSFLQRFEANQSVNTPWPAGHPVYAPPRLAPSVTATAQAQR